MVVIIHVVAFTASNSITDPKFVGSLCVSVIPDDVVLEPAVII